MGKKKSKELKDLEHNLKITREQLRIRREEVKNLESKNSLLVARVEELEKPVAMFLTCPGCSHRHIDTGVFETKVHHTHACQYCGLAWRPAVVATVGVQYLPGFKNQEK